MHPEDAANDDERFIKYIDSRMQWAATKAVDEALGELSHLRKDVADMKNDSAVWRASNDLVLGGIQKTLDKVDGWLDGTTSAEGVKTPGVLQKVQALMTARGWVIGLLGTISVALGVQTALTIARAMGLVGGTPH